MRCLIIILLAVRALTARDLVVGTYNVEMYIDAPFAEVEPKSELAKKIVRQSLHLLNADIVALEEIGGANTLVELQSSLSREGLNYPYSAWCQAHDTNIHLAFLSKLPIVSIRHHTNELFLHAGKRFHVARGFAEIDVEPVPGRRLTLISAHLKSKRISLEADQQALREQEALLLRARINEFFQTHPGGNLIVLGDFNDTITSPAIRSILGRGKTALFDPRPTERDPDAFQPNLQPSPRGVLWTHYFAREETYSRIDYILLSPSLKHSLDTGATFIPRVPNWGGGSDHRPIAVGLHFNN